MFLLGQTKRKRIPTSSWNVGIPFLICCLPNYFAKLPFSFDMDKLFWRKIKSTKGVKAKSNENKRYTTILSYFSRKIAAATGPSVTTSCFPLL